MWERGNVYEDPPGSGYVKRARCGQLGIPACARGSAPGLGVHQAFILHSSLIHPSALMKEGIHQLRDLVFVERERSDVRLVSPLEDRRQQRLWQGPQLLDNVEAHLARSGKAR